MICAYSKAVKGGIEGAVEGNEAEGQSSPVWLTSVEVAERWGLSVQTIRRYADSGKLPAFRDHLSRFSHRRFALSDCQAVLGVPHCEKEGKGASVGDARPVAIYARVSTAKQSRSFHKGEDGSDLARQVERLKAHCLDKYGVSPREFVDSASGLSFTRKGLESLVKAMLAGELDGGVLVCTHKDRLARFGVELIQMIAKSRNVEIVFCEAEEARSDDETAELAADIIAILTHFSAKIHGRRAAKTCSAPLMPETVQEALRMRKEGMYASQIAKILAAKNHKNSKGRPVNWYSIQALFDKAGDTLDPLLGDEVPRNSFEEWSEACLVKDEKARGHVQTIHKVYAQWCEANGKTPITWMAVQLYLKSWCGFHRYKGKRVYNCRLKAA